MGNHPFEIKQEFWHDAGVYYMQTYSEYKDRTFHPRQAVMGTIGLHSDVNVILSGTVEFIMYNKKSEYNKAVIQMERIIKDEEDVENNLKKLREL